MKKSLEAFKMWASSQVILTTALIALKVGGVMCCEWYYVFMPIWVPSALIALIVVVVALLSFINAMF